MSTFPTKVDPLTLHRQRHGQGHVGALRAAIENQIQVINSKLCEHVGIWGRNVVAHELPMVFDAPGIDLKQAQLFVYSSLVKYYSDKQYEVGVSIGETCTLYIAYVLVMDEKEVEAMTQLLRSHQLDGQGVARFTREGPSHRPLSAKKKHSRSGQRRPSSFSQSEAADAARAVHAAPRAGHGGAPTRRPETTAVPRGRPDRPSLPAGGRRIPDI